MPEDSANTAAKDTKKGNGRVADEYVLPITHAHVPNFAVEAGFWSALAGSVVLGVVEPPLGLLVGAGVLIARHRSKK